MAISMTAMISKRFLFTLTCVCAMGLGIAALYYSLTHELARSQLGFGALFLGWLLFPVVSFASISYSLVARASNFPKFVSVSVSILLGLLISYVAYLIPFFWCVFFSHKSCL